MISQARWIAPAGAERHKPCHFRAVKTLNFTAVPESLTVQITCDGNYLLEINGQCVGHGPARGTQYTAFYDEYEAAPYLHPGENTFTVLTVCMNFPAEATLPITPALCMAIGDLAATDRSWQTGFCPDEWLQNGPLFTRQSGYAEWRNLNFAGQMLPAETVEIPETSPLAQKNLCKRDIPLPLYTPVLPADVPVAAFVPPCDTALPDFAARSTAEAHLPLPPGCAGQLYELASGGEVEVVLPVPDSNGGVTLVVDFGKEVSGFVTFDLTAPAGTVADIAYEEELYCGDRLRADHRHTNPSYNFADRYILRAGRQQVGNVLMERGFRMVQLTLRNLTVPVTLHAVRAADCRYPFAPRGQFFCGDYQLNRLWETAKETISACTTDIFTDCPWRERLFYCNDFYIENRTALQIFGDKRIHRRALRLIFAQRRKDALFACCAPSIADEIPDNGKTDFHIILSGDLTLALTLRDYYRYTNDAEMVREIFPQLKQMMAQFASWQDENGIIKPPKKYWNFIDWSFELNGMDFSGKRTSLLNFLYISAAKAMIYLGEAIGEAPGISAEKIATLLQQTVKYFCSPETGTILNTDENPAAMPEHLQALGVPPESTGNVVTTSRLSHALALLAGADAGFSAAVADETLLTPELYYCIHVLDALEAAGKYAEALKLIRTHWGAMLDTGTPTLWENGVHMKGKAGFGGSASLCHAFSSAPASFLQTAVLGITPLAAGFATFKFAPCCPEVRFASGTVPTPHGAIRVKWTARDDGKIAAELHVPEKCSAQTPAGIFTAGEHQFTC
ncbi:MAG: family 78 glycoside hydrolase catalytic domain [Lentisphaeria bacterium]|nr:family 78 glycoside hydrolase catalytic domain [Lentisphaeria bacterium]